MIKRSIIISILIIFASILFNFSYSQTSTSSATSSDATTSKEKGDVYARASETYKYVSSFDGTSDSKTFDNQNTKEIGSLFNYLLTLMAIFIVILVIYRLVQGALFKGIFDNIYDQKKGRKYIQTAGTALVIFILAYAVLSFINPDLTGWTLATDFIGKKRIEGMVRNTGMCTGNSLAGTDVAQLIRQNEGFVACPYKDSKGIATIGIGYNLTNSSARKDLENAGITNIDAIMNYQAGSTNCPANAPKITEAQAIKLLENYLPKARATAVDFAGGESEFQSHPEDMQKILIDMAYNLDEARFNGPKGFNNMKAALRNHNYVDVAKEMVDSDWYKQVGDRAKKLVEIVKGFTCKTGNSDSVASGNYDLSKLPYSAQDAAKKILELNDAGKIQFPVPGLRTLSDGSDTKSQLQNIVSGKNAKLSSCSDRTNNTTGQTNIDPRILNFLVLLADAAPGYQLNTLANYCHSSNSNHYLGSAVDLGCSIKDLYKKADEIGKTVGISRWTGESCPDSGFSGKNNHWHYSTTGK